MRCNYFYSNWLPNDERRLTVRICYTLQGTEDYKETPYSKRRTVQGAKSHNVPLYKIPENLHDYFPFLVSIDFNGCGFKSISRADLRHFSGLRDIFLRNMEIKELEGKIIIFKIEILHKKMYPQLIKFTIIFFLYQLISLVIYPTLKLLIYRATKFLTLPKIFLLRNT